VGDFVERLTRIPKLDVAGSNPVGRSIIMRGYGSRRSPSVVSGNRMVHQSATV
jgi:hypothetical protein